LTDAFTTGCKTGVFLFGFSGCHVLVLSVSEDDVQRTGYSSRPAAGVWRHGMSASPGLHANPRLGHGLAGPSGSDRYTRPL
jgi:hypothetical protein